MIDALRMADSFWIMPDLGAGPSLSYAPARLDKDKLKGYIANCYWEKLQQIAPTASSGRSVLTYQKETTVRAVIICTLSALLTSPIQAAPDDQNNAAPEPADRVCNADAIGQTNEYIDCLIRAQSKFDAELDALIAQIPNSSKVKNDVLGKDVVPDARRRWRKNFAALAPAFRAYRYKNCEDEAITAVGYGMGGLQMRLACIINATSRQIDVLKKRYDLENSARSGEPTRGSDR